jgi:hypothetical protein
MNDPGLHVLDDRLVAWKRGAWEPRQVAEAHLGAGVEELVGQHIPVPEVVVSGDCHAVADAALLEGGAQVGRKLVAVSREDAAGCQGRGCFVAGRTVLVNACEWSCGPAVHFVRYKTAQCVLD